jgi:phosphoribosylaminoimidazole-succinocarboxamide synthase
MPSSPVLETSLSSLPVRRGKVRDVYDLGEQLLLVSTDRISAFDWVLPTGIPDKGRVLTQVSAFWFDYLKEPNHMLSTDIDEIRSALPAGIEIDAEQLDGRTMLCRKTKVVPVECVVRGYLVGSGWKDYQKSGKVCGIELPKGMQQAQIIEDVIFTPATKAETGHDENISFDEMVKTVGRDVAEELKRRSIDIYTRGREYAAKRGIIIADTKFEWGLVDDEIILIDEVLTPDSSRFWPADEYQVGSNPPSFDKQFVRDWLETTSWDKNSPAPALPADVALKTRAKYIEAFEQLTGLKFAWK